MRYALCLSLFCLAALGCGGGDVGGIPEGGTSPAEGTWKGEWLSHNGVGGAATMQLSPSGSGFTGSISFTNSPCFSSGAVSATVEDGEVAATVMAGAIEVTIDATITGTQMSGTYDAVSAGACTGDTGTFSASR